MGRSFLRAVSAMVGDSVDMETSHTNGSGGLLLGAGRGVCGSSQEHAGVLQLDARRNAPRDPVLHALNPASSLVETDKFGDFGGPAEVPNEF